MTEQTDVPQHAMVIVAHADDIEVNCAGTIAKWRQSGADITYVIVTNGAAGSNQEGVNPHELAHRREQEQLAAATVIGVERVLFLRHPDTVLEPSIALRKQFTRLIRQYKPDCLITHDPQKFYLDDYYINHPDHRATGEAALYAAFPTAESRLAFPELLDEGYEPHKVMQVWLILPEHSDHYEDISDFWSMKEQALMCHQSQIGEDTRAWLEERNRGWGEQIGAAYAEEFRIIRRR